MTLEEFILTKSGTVVHLEMLLRSLAYLLPARFKNTPLTAEVVFSALKSISQYHNKILESVAERQQPQPLSKFNRYARKLNRSSVSYHRVSWILEIIKAWQAVFEMAALRISKFARNKCIWILEILKMVARLYLLHSSGNRMILHQQFAERWFDVSNLHPEPVDKAGWTGKRTGKNFPSVDRLLNGDDIEPAINLLNGKAMDEPSVDPRDLLKPLDGIKLFSEYLYIARPVLYYALINRYGRKSWFPWLGSLGIELYTLSTRMEGYRPASELTNLESDETYKRIYLLAFYMLRSPFYNRFTRNKLQSVIDWTSDKVLFSILGLLLNEYKPLIDKYHFYQNKGF